MDCEVIIEGLIGVGQLNNGWNGGSESKCTKKVWKCETSTEYVGLSCY
jgi:hypothetical protein